MPPADDLQRRIVAQFGARVAARRRDLGQREPDIQLRQRRRRSAQPRLIARHLAQRRQIQVALQRGDLLLRVQHHALALAQLLGDVALAVRQRLPALIVVGHAAQVGLRDLDVVAEDLVVADAQRLDAGALALALLQRRDPPLRLARRGGQRVQFGAVATAQQAPVPCLRIFDGALDQLPRLVAAIQRRGKLLQSCRSAAFERRAQRWRTREARRQRKNLARIRRALHDARRQPLQVRRAIQQRAKLLAQRRIGV